MLLMDRGNDVLFLEIPSKKIVVRTSEGDREFTLREFMADKLMKYLELRFFNFDRIKELAQAGKQDEAVAMASSGSIDMLKLALGDDVDDEWIGITGKRADSCPGTTADSITWEEICHKLGSRYGMTPMTVWRSFPLRFLIRYFRIIMREELMDKIHQARCHGAQIEDPEWDDDRSNNQQNRKTMTSEEEYEAMKALHKKMKEDGTWNSKMRALPEGKIIAPK
jgi:hypothetical protein